MVDNMYSIKNFNNSLWAKMLQLSKEWENMLAIKERVIIKS